eukprot:360313-Chlamydomonas_euryale.AAC.4
MPPYPFSRRAHRLARLLQVLPKDCPIPKQRERDRSHYTFIHVQQVEEERIGCLQPASPHRSLHAIHQGCRPYHTSSNGPPSRACLRAPVAGTVLVYQDGPQGWRRVLHLPRAVGKCCICVHLHLWRRTQRHWCQAVYAGESTQCVHLHS